VRLATTAGDTAGGLTDPNLQGRKEAFSEKERASGYLPTRKQAQLSPYEVKQGTVIPGIMISGINSDLPGQIIAQVSQNVYDTATGKHLMIPQGTRLVGGYDSYVAVGQERAMVAWRRLQFPDGAVLDILNMPGADEGGYAGFNDQVNNHYVKIFGSAIMLSLVGAGYQLSQPTEHVGDPVTAQNILAAQIGQQLSQVSGEMIRRNMQIQPTIEIRPGYRFNVMVNKDMILEPYVERNP
jgi:type IV secretion system protein VirB10